jgi:hypothetical protein
MEMRNKKGIKPNEEDVIKKRSRQRGEMQRKNGKKM